MQNRFALAAAGIIAAAVFSSPQIANAQCTTASLFGVYGFNRVGVLIKAVPNTPEGNFRMNGVPQMGPFGVAIFASVGQFTADGAGHLTLIVQTISVNGVVYRNDQAIGQYTVNPDCTGSLVIRSALLATSVNYDFVFEAGNTVLRFVGADQATEVLGRAVLQGPVAACPAGLATLSGAFGYSSFGLFLAFKTLLVEALEGRFVFDGAGGLSYSHLTGDVNLNVVRGVSSNDGKYTVNSNCTGTLRVGDFTFPNIDFVLVNNGNSMLLINTDNVFGLSADIGEMTRQ